MTDTHQPARGPLAGFRIVDLSDNMAGPFATMILGVVGAIVGGLIWNAIFDGNEGIAWIGSIIAAIVLLVIYERVVAKKTA